MGIGDQRMPVERLPCAALLAATAALCPACGLFAPDPAEPVPGESAICETSASRAREEVGIAVGFAVLSAISFAGVTCDPSWMEAQGKGCPSADPTAGSAIAGGV